MAAIDPTAEPETDGQGSVPSVPRSTLKIYKANVDGDDEDEEDYLERLMGGEDDESDESDEEANGGPSDPSKSKKARREAAIKKLLAATQEDSDAEMEDVKPNGAKNKGKGKASVAEEEESDDEDEEDLDFDMEEYVVCTLDTERVCFTHFSPLFKVIVLTAFCTVLPAAHRYHHRRGREDFLLRQGHPPRLPHRQLRRSSR
jgi:FK506-binding nuclear protein